ncbi:hypothetical protein [Rheinheimera soli]|uniref:Pyocin activator protein PrtN n=1 Tax=Rheinheimera soli TaxID=443616 RepID=A0ABU1W549_9GAMM|nr:hypothetical protein [Rheinheimera soli]MDR7123091.1 hypothetical protein [Rheinheimera soli]
MKSTVDKEFVAALARALSLELRELLGAGVAVSEHKTPPAPQSPQTALSHLLYEELQERYGPLMSGMVLVKALGYGSADAFRQAVSRQTVPVAVFPIAERRGKFALTRDVALWLAEQRLTNTN